MRLVHDADSKVAELPVCDYRDIAACARKFADQVETGEHGEIVRVVLVIESDRGVGSLGWGENDCTFAIMGLLEAAKLQMFQSQQDEYE